MRTALEHSPTKDKLLDAAYDLMLSKGYVATTVDDVCVKADVTKGSFFHYFESKEALAKELLERACQKAKQMKEPFEQEKDPLKRVFGHVDFFIKMSKDKAVSKGCLLGTLAQELSDTNPEIRKICCDGFNRMAEGLSGDLDEAKKEYAPSSKFISRSLADHFVSVLEGSLILAKTHKDPKIVEENLEHFKQYLKQLFKK